MSKFSEQYCVYAKHLIFCLFSFIWLIFIVDFNVIDVSSVILQQTFVDYCISANYPFHYGAD